MQKRILIIDDEPLIRTALSAAFREEDISVIAVSCGSDALTEIDRNTFDLCFIDIHLPDMNGLNIMKTVKTVSPGTKIVIMTGSEVDDEMLKFIREYADLLMAKPFDLDRIKTFTTRVLTHAFRAAGQADNAKGGEAFETWLEEDQRQHKRYVTVHTISCVAAAAEGSRKENSFSASVLDISAAGMGIRADCSLKPGHLIGFSGSSILGMGIVQWCTSAGASCRAGVRFVEPGQLPRASRQQA